MANKTLPSSSVLMVTGVAAIAMGLVLLISPAAVGGAVVRLVALVLFVLGLAQVVHALRASSRAQRTTSAIIGILVIGVGVLIGLYPELGSGALTLLLMAFFVVNGVWKIFTGFRFRPVAGWTWLLLSGLLSFVLTGLLWKQWPLSGAWAIGVLVGVELLSAGLALVRVGKASRRHQSRYIETINL